MHPDDRFIEPLLKSLAQIIPLKTGYKLDRVKQITSYEMTVDTADMSASKLRLLEHCEHNIELVEHVDVPEVKGAHKLIINPSELEYTLEFKKKRDSDSLLTIPLKDIELAAASTRHKGTLRKKNDLLIQLIFNGKSLKFDVEDEHINTILEQIHLLKDVEDNPLAKKSITLGKNPKLCTICTKNKYSFEIQSQILCPNCFEAKYGKLLLQTVAAQYYGGHKAYLAGGVFGTYQSGKMYLTEKYLIFVRGDKNPSKKWEIVIPFDSIIIERWNVEEKSRRQQIAVGGTNISNVGMGSGVIHESGKEHHIVVPYIDENGVSQEPRFGVSSWGGKAIREWATELYNRIVEVKSKHQIGVVGNPTNTVIASKTTLTANKPNETAESKEVVSKEDKDILVKPRSPITIYNKPSNEATRHSDDETTPNKMSTKESAHTPINENTATKNDEQFLNILKMRLVKGEISKEEYMDLRKMIEEY